jgi:hypothetical protein
MAANAVQFGDGLILEVNDGAASAFVAVTEIESITPPGHTRRMVERRRLSNTTFVERKASPKQDPGDCTLTVELTDVLHVRLAALDGVEKSYRVTYLGDGLRLAWTGVLSALKPSQVQGDAFAMSQVTISCVSLITITDNVP